LLKLVGIYTNGYAAPGTVDPVMLAFDVVVVVDVVPCGNMNPVEVVDAELPLLPPVAVSPSVPVHFAPVGQQA
jgi:hypothetical protein